MSGTRRPAQKRGPSRSKDSHCIRPGLARLTPRLTTFSYFIGPPNIPADAGQSASAAHKRRDRWPRVLGCACGPRQGRRSPLTVIVRAVGRTLPSAHSVPSEYMRIRSDQIAGGATREAVKAKTRAVRMKPKGPWALSRLNRRPDMPNHATRQFRDTKGSFAWSLQLI